MFGRLRNLPHDFADGCPVVQPVHPSLAPSVCAALQDVTVQLIDDLTRIGCTRLLGHCEAGRKSQQAGENKSTHHDCPPVDCSSQYLCRIFSLKAEGRLKGSTLWALQP
jgi:hypothetical protein